MPTRREMMIVTCLSALCAWLAFQLHDELHPGAVAAPQAEVTGERPEQASLDDQIAEFDPTPMSHYSEVVSRPLFAPTRRPFQPQAITVRALPAREPGLSIIVSGVVITGSERIVVVHAPGRSEFKRLSLGETFEGWTLMEIREDGLSFERNDKRIDVGLAYVGADQD